MPSQDMEVEQTDNQLQEQLDRLRSENKALQKQLNEQSTNEETGSPKKWYQFWKG